MFILGTAASITTSIWIRNTATVKIKNPTDTSSTCLLLIVYFGSFDFSNFLKASSIKNKETKSGRVKISPHILIYRLLPPPIYLLKNEYPQITAPRIFKTIPKTTSTFSYLPSVAIYLLVFKSSIFLAKYQYFKAKIQWATL